jgi:phosphatidylinositol glycan class A protein
VVKQENLDQNDNEQIRKLMESNTKYSICITTDFVAPKFGGVETHSYQLAQCLIERGHKVIIISNMYNYCREGVRYMANGLKVYHLPLLPILRNDVGFAALFNITSLLR